MEFLWYALAGVSGGLLGGMGMGGGTVLIPILSLFFNLGQHTVQAVNLISSIPMAVIALIIHVKNGLVDFKGVLPIIITGVIFCIIGCFVARNINGSVLRRIFGGFLILLSVIQVVTYFKDSKKGNEK